MSRRQLDICDSLRKREKNGNRMGTCAMKWHSKLDTNFIEMSPHVFYKANKDLHGSFCMALLSHKSSTCHAKSAIIRERKNTHALYGAHRKKIRLETANLNDVLH